MDYSPRIHYHANKVKALTNLEGILAGINADSTLKDEEVLFLSTWLRDQSSLPRDGDVLDIQDLIADILEDGVITPSERKDLRQLIRDILKYGDFKSGRDESDLINQYLGFLQGISVDGDLNDKEIKKLNSLINKNHLPQDHWSVNIVDKKLKEVLADGFISEQERKELLQLVYEVCGSDFLETGSTSTNPAQGITDKVEIHSLQGISVCFTGEITNKTRQEAQDEGKRKGSTIKGSVSRKLDLLVVGGVASTDWKFSTYGRKIEKVLSNRELYGMTTKIVDEETWSKIVDSCEDAPQLCPHCGSVMPNPA